MTETRCPICGDASRRTLVVRPKQPALCQACFETRATASSSQRMPGAGRDYSPAEIDRLFKRALADIRAARRRLTTS